MVSDASPNVSRRIVAGFWREAHWGMDSQELNTFIHQLIESGIESFDHAYVYNSEELFGEALSLSPAIRDKVEIITKCGIRAIGDQFLDAKKINHYDSTKETILNSVDNSLRMLKTEYINTLLLHRPDYLMDVEEVSDAFNRLKEAGKVKNFGVSNFNPTQFDLLQDSLDFKLSTNQIEFSPFNTSALDNGLMDQCYKNRINPMIWSCLGGGKLFDHEDSVTKRLSVILKKIIEETDADSISQVIYAWALMLPCRPRIITGSGKIENIKPLVDSVNLQLSREQWYQIWCASVGHGVA